MKKLLVVVFAVLGLQANAQTFKIGADIRERAEYSHGFGNLTMPNAEPGFFVAQRARLNTSYATDKLKVMVSFQDVSTWGATRQILPTDHDDSFSLAQAWAELQVTKTLSLKMGRQPLVYDDQRILGGLDWAMQGRFHDAGLVRFKKNGFKLDVVGSFSNTGQSRVGSDYTVTGFFSYKTMQMVHVSHKWKKLSASLLFLNNGFQRYDGTDPDGVFNRQTGGAYIKAKPSKSLTITGSAYSQFGKATATTDLSAYDVLLDINFKATSKLSFGLGGEMLSGNDSTTPEQEAFFPLYGTNHKFNGYMDYFYVGNHANNVGLNDIHVSAKMKTGKKSSIMARAHYFTANTDIGAGVSNDLGTELDLVFATPVMKDVVLKAGYSQMFAKDGMKALKNVASPSGTQNWAWVMFVIKPALFTSKKEAAPTVAMR